MNYQDYCYWLSGLLQDFKNNDTIPIFKVRDKLREVISNEQAKVATCIDFRGMTPEEFYCPSLISPKGNIN